MGPLVDRAHGPRRRAMAAALRPQPAAAHRWPARQHGRRARVVGGASRLGALDTTAGGSTHPEPPGVGRAATPAVRGRPAGALWARADGDAVEALAWADRTAPRLLRLEPEPGPGPPPHWSASARTRPRRARPSEPTTCSSWGRRPCPVGGRVPGGRPRRDRVPARARHRGRSRRSLLHVREDGSTHDTSDDEVKPSLRVGAGRDPAAAGRSEAAERVGVRAGSGGAPEVAS